MKNLFLFADYIEFQPESFKGFILKDAEGTFRRFDGEPLIAFQLFQEWWDSEGIEGGYKVLYTSSIDNYLLDSHDESLADLIYVDDVDSQE
jgi:hypothetical protein